MRSGGGRQDARMNEAKVRGKREEKDISRGRSHRCRCRRNYQRKTSSLPLEDDVATAAEGRWQGRRLMSSLADARNATACRNGKERFYVRVLITCEVSGFLRLYNR